jgi:hypothetical protein
VEPTPRKWCPLYETSLHDVTACLYIEHLVEICSERLAKRAIVGVTHGCYEDKARWEPSQGAVRTTTSQEGLPRDEAIA